MSDKPSDEDVTPAKSKSEKASARPALFSEERKQFRALLIGNPNYFGNLKQSPFKPVKAIVSNKTYEELTCVGYNPQLSKLEAVVYVKQESGYNGGICTPGSTEYVRFWLSFDNGVTWIDQGMESFTAYDIPGPHPLEYAVALRIDPARLFCTTENLPMVRAILSWNDPPVDPNTPPVWGNTLDGRIQIEPWFIFYFADLLKAGVKIPPQLTPLLDETQPVKLKKPPRLSPLQLQRRYVDKGVPDHRFLHGELHKLIANPELAVATQLTAQKGVFADLAIDISKVIDAFLQTDGNTSFEELECVGLDPNPGTPDALVGVLKIKRPTGYLGDLCEEGSTEYVAFWIDWGDGVWHWNGTAQVQVHDINGIPPQGLHYAVYQPVNLEPHRRPCLEGPVVARVRAILSWNTPPNPANPDWVPPWGNREETRIHVYPGAAVSSGDYTPYLQNLCGIHICNVDQGSGFAPGERPWGATINIHGHIPGAPNVLTPAANRPRYQITVTSLVPPGPPQQLNDPFPLTVDEQIGAAIPTATNVTQSADGLDFYPYLEAPPVPGVGWRTVSPSRLLAVWNTGNRTGLWEISIEAKDPVTNVTFAAGTTLCVLDGTTRQTANVYLDQAAPLAALAITGYQHNGVGPVLTDQLDCGTFQVGDVIHGSYSVSDDHFNSLSLTAAPVAGGGAGLFTIDGINTNSRSYPTVPTTGQSGNWTFNTAGLAPCGYTIQLHTSDRTIVSCGSGWQNNGEFVGFCLVAAP